MRIYSAENIEKLVKAAQKHKIICIADEVFTGFGRTGKNFASDYIATRPDLVCLSKGITGGFLPLGITAVSEDIAKSFDQVATDKIFYHGHSYTGNPIACAAANASLRILLQEETKEKIERIESLHQNFSAELEGNEKIKNVKVQGTILSIELQTQGKKGYFNDLRDKIYQYFLSKNILLRPLGNVIYVLPPYCISEKELKFIYQEIQNFLSLV
jgi:adenosylmethionine-8-amino-7-oxononanoate aminotransferase